MEVLREVLKAARTSDDVNEYLFTKLHLASIEDFVCIVSAADYESELRTLVIDNVPSAKDVPIELARIRAAWRRAKAELLKLEDKSRRGVTQTEELEEALEPNVQEDLVTRFSKAYGIQITVHMSPADTLLARVYRELARGVPTVISMSKVKSLFQAHKPNSERKIMLGANVTVKLDEPETVPIKSVIHYYNALRILGNAYALAGSNEVPSHADPKTRVRNCPLQVQLDYSDFVLRMAAQAEAPVSWVAERDETTRGRMVELIRQGWSQGEALSKAMVEQEIYWHQPPLPQPNKRPAPLEEAALDSSAKRAKTGNLYMGREICKRRNDQRGCSNPSCTKEHRCDVLVGDAVCGSKQHTRLQCPHYKR